MFVALKYSNATLIIVLLLSLLALLQVIQSESARKAVEVRYLKLLQKQTAQFADFQSEQKRIGFLSKHKSLLKSLDRSANTEQLKGLVLEHLEGATKGGLLTDVSYDFLPSKKLMAVSQAPQLIYDSVRLKGRVNHMVDFNRAMDRLSHEAEFLFELHRCDIHRKQGRRSDLSFDCLLRWYVLR